MIIRRICPLLYTPKHFISIKCYCRFYGLFSEHDVYISNEILSYTHKIFLISYHPNDPEIIVQSEMIFSASPNDEILNMQNGYVIVGIEQNSETDKLKFKLKCL